MNALYFIVILFISNTTGELDHREVSTKPVTLRECTQALLDRGPVKVVDGMAQVGVCVRADAINGHTNT